MTWTPPRVFWWGVAVSAGAAALTALYSRMATASPKSTPLPPAPGNLPVGGTVVSDAPPFRLTQAEIIQAARERRLEYDWIELPGFPGISVFADTAKIGGIRVPVSARTTAAIVAELALLEGSGWRVSPTTPLLEDAIYNMAGVKTRPVAQDVDNTPAAVPAFGRDLDRQIRSQTEGKTALGPSLVASVGKSWVLSNLVLEHAGRAINYGFHWPAGTPSSGGGPWPSVDGKSKVFQQPSWAHDMDHYDYSQTLRLCRLAPGAVLPSHEVLRTNRLWT